MRERYPAATIQDMARLVKLVAGTLGGLLYLWFAAVRSVPFVRRRKTARRRALLARRSANLR